MIQRLDVPSLGLLAWFQSLPAVERERIDELVATSPRDDEYYDQFPDVDEDPC